VHTGKGKATNAGKDAFIETSLGFLDPFTYITMLTPAVDPSLSPLDVLKNDQSPSIVGSYEFRQLSI